MSNLSELGFGPDVQSQFESLQDQSLRPARVSLVYGVAGYRIWTESGETDAVLAGRVRHRSGPLDLPAVGDWVAVAPVDPPRIEAVLPRRSQLVRQAAGRRTEPQVMAANVDVVLLVAAAGGELNLRRVERYLAAIRGSGAEPVVVINKTDLVEDEATLRAELAATAAEVPVLAVSAKTGAGFEQLRALLAPGRTMVVVGSSGVGKSTIVNRLLGAERQATGDVREDDQKGRHTTTTRHLLPVPLEGGHRAVLIDTPGLRELQLWADTSEADAAFAEIQALAAHCRFADCTHEREPGCAVREAVARGELAAERLESLRKLERERAKQALRQDARGRQEEHRQGKRTGKVLREIERFNPKRKK